MRYTILNSMDEQTRAELWNDHVSFIKKVSNSDSILSLNQAKKKMFEFGSLRKSVVHEPFTNNL